MKPLDRLTRALAHFIRLVEAFDGCRRWTRSFQRQFIGGQLTLNVPFAFTKTIT
jgi:hypothetical protein